jgi:cytidine deaminase
VYAEGPTLAMPCGMCRQVLSEFGLDATVVVGGPAGTRTTTLAALLPEPFVFEVAR